MKAYGGLNSLRVADYFIDASVAGEGALVLTSRSSLCYVFHNIFDTRLLTI